MPSSSSVQRSTGLSLVTARGNPILCVCLVRLVRMLFSGWACRWKAGEGSDDFIHSVQPSEANLDWAEPTVVAGHALHYPLREENGGKGRQGGRFE